VPLQRKPGTPDAHGGQTAHRRLAEQRRKFDAMTSKTKSTNAARPGLKHWRRKDVSGNAHEVRRLNTAFSISEVRDMVGEDYYQRGQRYFEDGRVLRAEFASKDRLQGDVQGSRPHAYEVNVAVAMDPDGTPYPDVGLCTCPVAVNCKHVAAVLLAARRPGKGEIRAARKEGVSSEVRGWLNNWDEAAAPKAQASEGLEPGKEHLFYVIHRDDSGRPMITPHRVYPKKDGGIGGNSLDCRDSEAVLRAKFITAADAALLGRLGYYRDRHLPNRYNWPDGEELAELVRNVVKTGRARADSIRGVTLSWVGARPCHLSWEIFEADRQQIVARDASGAPLTLLPFPTPFFVNPETGEIGEAETGYRPRLAHWLASAPPVGNESVSEVAEKLSRIGRGARMPRLARVKMRKNIRPQAVLRLFGCAHKSSQFASGWNHGASDGPVLHYPCANLEIAYEGSDARLRVGQGDDVAVPDGRCLTVIRRDHACEEQLQERLWQEAASYAWSDRYTMRYERDPPGELKNADVVFAPFGSETDGSAGAGLGFFFSAAPRLRSEGWLVEMDDSWPFRLHEGPVEFSTTIGDSDREGNDWFSLKLMMEVDGKSFDLAPVVYQLVEDLPVDEGGRLKKGFDVESHLADRIFHAPLGDGSWVALEGPRLARFAEAFLEAQGLLAFHKADAGRLFQLAEALEGCGVPWTGGREILDLGARLRALATTPEHEPPAMLQGELRPYQRTGFGWLKALSEIGLGGVLADDMGLGKTVQTLALLVHRHLEEKTPLPSLLVVPTSLIGNWRREAERFAPGLKLLVLHGPDRRERFPQVPDHHLVITTYPLLNRDSKRLFNFDYEIAVLDEAQAVKNPAAAVSKRIRDIRARQRIALTGTPLENNLQELWSLSDWLIPGLLGNRKAFTKEFRTPIEMRGNRARQRLLSARLKPFLMRRTKDEVAKDLPEKTVIDELVPLEGPQAALYESIRSAMDDRVRKAIAARGLTASRIAIFDALLKLRQVCCDPRLVKLAAARKVEASAKRERLTVLLEEMVAEGRRVLVFSQFVQMLKLIEKDVVARGWNYSMLHGSTRKRDEQVAAFQSGDRPLFLISLKAGGTGLNLTAADTVVIYDPWWNPAVERQAMDRAHRIGQDKPVFVHRLIAEHTVEAAIQKMQIRKQALADAVFEGAGKGPLELTDEDINALFGPPQEHLHGTS